MSEPKYILVGSIILGVLLVGLAPYLSRVRTFLPPPRSVPGKVASIVAGEAIACVFITSGLNGLMSSSLLSSLLSEATTFTFIIFVMAIFAGFILEAAHRDQDANSTDPPS